MRLILAPMEGVVDTLMRDTLTRSGAFDLCVTEFIRIVDQRLPQKVFHRYCPELNNNGMTPSGTPVRIQLLGQCPHWLAENAIVAQSLGSHGIDLNFGCPAKTVNKNRGGAVLLQEPEKIYNIVKNVRKSLPKEVPLSAKIRLGYDDKSLAFENADAVYQGGADELTIHARTKKEGYRPPAHWDWIAKIKQRTPISIIANGEVWTPDDYQNCREQSQCNEIMLGRGALANPGLADEIRRLNQGSMQYTMPWTQVLELLIDSAEKLTRDHQARYFSARTKQWLGYLRLQYPEAQTTFEKIKRLHLTQEVVDILRQGHTSYS